MSGRPRVTFGMIVLNGMPFLPYNLRALYPFAHQIVVVEGAAPGAAGIATADGHSRDGTLEEARRFAREEDPEGKVEVVTAEQAGHDDGFWPGEKDEQSRAYAARATGDYLWQVDTDEFYLPQDMERVLRILAAEPGITAVSFPTVTFWGSPDVVVDGWFLRRGARDYHRLFRWEPGSAYARHRPPTVVDPLGRDTREVCWLGPRATEELGIVLRHYSLLFPRQACEKIEYYLNWGLYGDWFADGRRWLADSYLTLRRPYRVHNVYRYPSWLERYDGSHPPEVQRMMADIRAGRVREPLRGSHDVERLLDSPGYALGRDVLRLAEPADRVLRRLRWQARPALRRSLRRLKGEV